MSCALFILVACIHKSIIILKYHIIDEPDHGRCILGEFLYRCRHIGTDLLDIVCRTAAVFRQMADLACDHRKTASRFTRSGCFNAGIQRQQVGLGCDPQNGVRQFIDLRYLFRILHGPLQDCIQLLDPVAGILFLPCRFLLDLACFFYHIFRKPAAFPRPAVHIRYRTVHFLQTGRDIICRRGYSLHRTCHMIHSRLRIPDMVSGVFHLPADRSGGLV